MKKVLTVAAAAFILGAPLAGQALAQGQPQSLALLKVDPGQISAGYRASKVTGSSVVNEKNETVGKVDDVIITKDGSKQFAVLSVGGFLGIGDHLVAVPYDSLQISADNKITLPGASKDELKALPEFKYASNSTTTTTTTRPTVPATPNVPPSSSTAPVTAPPSTTR